MDRIQVNRRILQLNGRLNLYPWRFESRGKLVVCKTTILRSLGFKIELSFAALYAVYINLTLLRTVLAGTDRYDVFGFLMLRALVSTAASYWAYEFFIAKASEHEILYNFTQLSPGNVFSFQSIITAQFYKGPVLKFSTDLPLRLNHPIVGSNVQELLLASSPYALYLFCPMLTALFLLDASDEQFMFSLLPAEMRGERAWMLVWAVMEFRFLQFSLSIIHFATFHCVTCLRVIQTTLAHSVERIR